MPSGGGNRCRPGPIRGPVTATRLPTNRCGSDGVYLPVEVPAGVNKISVSYSYSKPTVTPGLLSNACDIGVFDEKGADLAGKGFRGWSGGFRTEFFISAAETTPGYLPGPVGKGTWNIALGPYQVAEQGMDYTVSVTLDYGPDVTPLVNAAALSHDAVLDGIRNGRSWIAESAGISLVFTVSAGGRKAGVGERLDVKADAPGDCQHQRQWCPQRCHPDHH